MDKTVGAASDCWVICLCAEWCGVCREWRPVFERQAHERHEMNFAWVDVEDEALAMGDVDIETFPTLLIAAAGQARFFGPIAPSVQQLQRLLASVQTQPAALPAEAQPLVRRLEDGVLARTRL